MQTTFQKIQTHALEFFFFIPSNHGPVTHQVNKSRFRLFYP